jgi:hypothetical protein
LPTGRITVLRRVVCEHLLARVQQLQPSARRPQYRLSEVVYEPIQGNPFAGSPFDQERLYVLFQIRWDMKHSVRPGIMFPALGAAEIVLRLHLVF